MIHFIDVRCDGISTGGPRRQAGLSCNYLLCRVDENMQGTIETKCVRCNAVRMWSYPLAPLLVGTS